MTYQRTRQRSSVTVLPTSPYYVHTCSCASPWGCSYDVFTAADQHSVGTAKTFSDVVVPGFNRRRKKGEVFFNPMTSVERTVSAPSGLGPELVEKALQCTSPHQYSRKWKIEGPVVGFMTRINNGVDGFGLPIIKYSASFDPKPSSSLIGEATTACLAEVGTHDANLWESVAEIRKSATLLADMLDSANRALDKAPLRAVMSRAQAAGSAYLAYRYGLKPIMNDVAAVVAGVSKKLGTQRETSRGAAMETKNDSISFSQSHISVAMTVNGSTTVTNSVRAMSLNEYWASLGANVGFRRKALTTLPWELLPYSFVVDWFANVGDYINALVPAHGYRELGSCVVLRSERVQTLEVVSSSVVSPTLHTLLRPANGSLRITEVHSERTVGLPSPKLVWKSDFKLDTLTRASDAIALLLQKLVR